MAKTEQDQLGGEKKESDFSLLNWKDKILIGLIVIGGLLLTVLKFLFRLVLGVGFAFLIYGFFVHFRGDSFAKWYLLGGAGMFLLALFALRLFRFFETRNDKKKEENCEE